jgi:translation initiation factor RLI1
MTKTLQTFKLNVEEGSFTNCEIIVLLGENGTGKTTFVRMLSGDKKCLPDDTSFEVKINLNKIRSQNLQYPTSHKQLPQNTQEQFRNYCLIN